MKAATFDLYSTLIVPPVAERLAVEMSLPISEICYNWDSNTQPSACDANALTDCAAAAMYSER